MQGIYTCIPETNYVPREYSVTAILLLLYYYYYSLQLSFQSVAVVLTLVTNKNKYT